MKEKVKKLKRNKKVFMVSSCINIGLIIMIIGILVFIFCLLCDITTLFKELLVFLIGIYFLVWCMVSTQLFLGLAEIIELLTDIKNKK